ncbi:hypothetical protein ALP64_202730 [Pseudomonas syringae pv. actinidiae]|nr:hypothetical protein ALP64_202730 [Pseudomonas syringae pv. actinidiae]
MRLQPRLDFAQFDAETADFDLMVDTPGVFNGSGSFIAGQIAGAVQTTAVVGERVRHKALGSQRRTIVITPRQTGMANVQLATATLSDRVEIGVQYVPRQVRDCLANRAGRVLRVGLGYGPVGHMHGGFGDAVHVDQLRRLIAEACKPGFEAGDVQRFAAKDDFL